GRSFHAFMQTTADANGRIHFERVPPGVAKAARITMGANADPYHPRVTWSFPSQTVDVTPGRSTSVVIGGHGRPSNANLGRPEDGSHVRIRLYASQLDSSARYGVDGIDAFLHSPAGMTYQRNEVRIADDGTFRIPHVLPEDYMLMVYAVSDAGAVSTLRKL